MEEHIVKILRTEWVTHDVKRFQFEKPAGYAFNPGQATEISINQPGFIDKRNPFTFTCLNSEQYLEFTIKIYTSRNGVTNKLSKLGPGDEIIIRDVWGAISYKGKGVFIAGGAGITPFIAILRDLYSKNEIAGNKLLCANKTKDDIILNEEFSRLLGKDFVNILSDEKVENYSHGYINTGFLKANITDFTQKFYVCGPPPMMESVLKQLAELGVGENSITLEL